MRSKFQNSQVAKIIGITQRQVIAWTEKGLIDPIIEASGAGTKREYSRTNLLEFGLLKKLLHIGLGIQTAKKIMTNLRKSGSIISWVEDFVGYHERMTKQTIENFEQFLKTEPIRNTKAAQEFLEGLKSLQTKDYGTHGFLVVMPGANDDIYISVLPYDINYVFELIPLKEEISSAGGVLIVDLGGIKAEIENRI